MNESNHVSPRGDVYLAAELLYGELRLLPWFAALVVDEEGRTLVMESHDLAAAQAWSGREWFGWRVDVRRGRAVAR